MQPLFLSFLLVSFCSNISFALVNDTWSLGLSYFSQNFWSETAQKRDGSAGFLGTANYALDLGYETSLANAWYWSGRLLYTPLPRVADGNTADITLTQLKFLGGQNLDSLGRGGLVDYFFGLGIIKEDSKGKGGIVQMNNGTGTSSFAVPGSSSSNINGTQSVGMGYSFGATRVLGEIVFENLLNESKRTQSLVIGFLYSFQKPSKGSRK